MSLERCEREKGEEGEEKDLTDALVYLIGGAKRKAAFAW